MNKNTNTDLNKPKASAPETRISADLGNSNQLRIEAEKEAQQPQPETRTDWLPSTVTNPKQLDQWAKDKAQQPQHSPLPWRTGDLYHTIFGPPNGEPSPETIATVRKKANARLIVASVNHADKLAAALQDIAARANFMLVRDPMNNQADYLLQQANNALREYQKSKGGGA